MKRLCGVGAIAVGHYQATRPAWKAVAGLCEATAPWSCEGHKRAVGVVTAAASATLNAANSATIASCVTLASSAGTHACGQGS